MSGNEKHQAAITELKGRAEDLRQENAKLRIEKRELKDKIREARNHARVLQSEISRLRAIVTRLERDGEIVEADQRRAKRIRKALEGAVKQRYSLEKCSHDTVMSGCEKCSLKAWQEANASLEGL